MRSVADPLRRETTAKIATLTPEARIELALRLGDDDAELFAATHGLTREAAIEQLARARTVGRRRSVASQPR